MIKTIKMGGERALLIELLDWKLHDDEIYDSNEELVDKFLTKRNKLKNDKNGSNSNKCKIRT